MAHITSENNSDNHVPSISEMPYHLTVDSKALTRATSSLLGEYHCCVSLKRQCSNPWNIILVSLESWHPHGMAGGGEEECTDKAMLCLLQ